MQNKGLIITTIVFFLLVNTSYYWEGKLGFWAMFVLLLLVLVYVWLAVNLLHQLYSAIKEKLKQKERLIVIGLLSVVVLLTYFKPSGIIDFDKLEGKDILVAEREGSANCTTVLKLKDDFTFRERNVCFGITVVKGTFRVVQDTIYFDNVNSGRYGDDFYKFAVIRPTIFSNSKILSDLVRYRNVNDTAGHLLWITKNELQRLKGKSLAKR